MGVLTLITPRLQIRRHSAVSTQRAYPACYNYDRVTYIFIVTRRPVREDRDDRCRIGRKLVVVPAGTRSVLSNLKL